MVKIKDFNYNSLEKSVGEDGVLHVPPCPIVLSNDFVICY